MSPDQLVEVFRGNDEALRSKAFSLLIDMGSPAVKPLAKATADTDEEVCRYAFIALGMIGHPDAIPALKRGLGHKSKRVRIEALYALSKFHHDAALDPLLEMMRDEDVVCRRQAAFALGEFRNDRAIEALMLAMDDTDKAVRASSSFSLATIGDPIALDRLINSLFKEEDPATRGLLCRSLGKFNHPKVVDPLLTCLGDHELSVREEASYSLGSLGSQEVRSRLHDLLISENKEIKIAAAAALGFMGDISSEKELDRLWNEELPDWVRVRIARGLVLIRNDQEAFKYLLGKISGDSLPISIEAMQALGKIGNPDAIDPIIEILRLEKNQLMHFDAIDALKLITGKNLGRRSALWVDWYDKEWKPNHPREEPK